MLIVFDEKNPHSAVIAGWGLLVNLQDYSFSNFKLIHN